jgi:DNA-binding NtrC family response regulator
LEVLSAYPWPGNVRELRNVIERAVILEDREILLPEHLHLDGAVKASNLFQPELPGEGISLEQVEKELIGKALDKVGGNQVRAAHLLGISRDVLRYRMKKYQIGGSKGAENGENRPPARGDAV